MKRISLIIISLAITLGGCGGELGAIKTKGFAAVGYSQMQSAWLKYDDTRQQAINDAHPYREDAKAALDAYRKGEKAIALKVLDAAGLALEEFDHGLAAYQAGAKKDMALLIARLWLALGDAAAQLAKIGVKVPTIEQMKAGGAP